MGFNQWPIYGEFTGGISPIYGLFRGPQLRIAALEKRVKCGPNRVVSEHIKVSPLSPAENMGIISNEISTIWWVPLDHIRQIYKTSPSHPENIFE